MAKSTPNQIDRSRPSSRPQPQGLLDSTPVLFRLPNVQVHPLPSVNDVPSIALQQAKAESAEPTVSEPVAPPVSVVSQPSAVVEEKQSWWEHWSSGIVLIVLLVAMYVTSIVVLKNRSQKPTNTLADEKTEFGDLANMEVPTIEASKEAADATPLIANQTIDTTPTLELDSATSASAEELASSISDSLSLPNDLTNAVNSQPIAQAQLLEPTQMPQMLPLLNNSSTLGENSSLSAQPVSSKNGQSPNLYDGADKQPEASPQSSLAQTDNLTPSQAQIGLPSQPVASGTSSASTGTNTMSTTHPSAPAQGPSSLTLSNNAIPTYSNSYSQTNLNSTAIPNIVPGVGQTPTISTVSTATGSMRQTATPEADGSVEAIIRAYIEKKRADSAAQQQINVPANSFQPTR